jgi:hypothetical protein
LRNGNGSFSLLLSTTILLALLLMPTVVKYPHLTHHCNGIQSSHYQ